MVAATRAVGSAQPWEVPGTSYGLVEATAESDRVLERLLALRSSLVWEAGVRA
jgi:hypothetical protein